MTPEPIEMARSIRRIVLEQSHRANVGHIGSALSVADIIAAIYGGVIDIPSASDPDRDRFILSKGHAALALYAALSLTGIVRASELQTYCGEGSLLGVHPEHALPGVDFSTGSLGMGLSVASGAALAAKKQRSRRRIFALLSDAECNEGSTWEAVMFAAHHGLDNLLAIIDENGQQAIGYTRDVLSLDPMRLRWEGFGWDVHDVDGHDVLELQRLMQPEPEESSPKPRVLIAHTTFGKGVSYMENRIEWHYLPMSDAQFEQALRESAGP